VNNVLFHWHKDIEILLVTEGSTVVNTGRKQYLLKEDELLIINSNEIHGLTRTHDTNTMLVVQFDPMLCKEYYPKLQKIKFTHKHIKESDNTKCWSKIKKCLTEIAIDYHEKKEGHQLNLVSTLHMLIYHLISFLPYETVEDEKLLSEERKLERLNRIISYIQENYAHKISLKDIAQNENLNMHYLSYFIKENLGITFQQYLNKVRLEKAVSLFMKTNMSKLDICIESGFSDYRYFSDTFKKEYGCTPAQYKPHNNYTEPITIFTDDDEEHNAIDQYEALIKLIGEGCQ
jgi:AraC-like DNA-binding protein